MVTIDNKTAHVVRASTELRPETGAGVRVGPFSYEIMEPLKRVRMSLEDNEHGLSFSVDFDGRFPAYEQVPMFSRLRGTHTGGGPALLPDRRLQRVVQGGGEEVPDRQREVPRRPRPLVGCEAGSGRRRVAGAMGPARGDTAGGVLLHVHLRFRHAGHPHGAERGLGGPDRAFRGVGDLSPGEQEAGPGAQAGRDWITTSASAPMSGW